MRYLPLALLLCACSGAPEAKWPHPAEVAQWLHRLTKTLQAAQHAEHVALENGLCWEKPACPEMVEHEERWKEVWFYISQARETITDANRGLRAVCAVKVALPQADVPIPDEACKPYMEPAE